MQSAASNYLPVSHFFSTISNILLFNAILTKCKISTNSIQQSNLKQVTEYFHIKIIRFY